MRLLFASMPTYRVALNERQAYWHRVRRIGADMISEVVCGFSPPNCKKSLCRGLWLIASEAKKAGHDVRWFDIPPDGSSIPLKDLAWAEQLWLYAMTPTLAHCLRLAALAKKINSGITVFLGGPHTRYLMEETLHCNNQIDFAEFSPSPAAIVAEYINDAVRIPGIAYRSNGKVKVNPSEYPKIYSERVDPSVLPLPLDAYYINTSSSQGCGQTCDFCLEGQVPLRLREMDDMKQELKTLSKALGTHGIIHFFDTSLWAIPKRCLELTEFITNSTMIRALSCDLEARAIRHDLLYALRSARVRFIALGFESCNDNILKCIGKDGTFKERLDVAMHVRTAMPSTTIKAYWLLGLPGSTKSTLKEELAGIRYVLEESIVDLVSAKLFVPYPGLRYYERPHEYGLELTRDYSMYDRFSLPPACFPSSVGRDYLAKILLECEQLVAECYANRLGFTHEQIAASGKAPQRYNGSLYFSRNT